MTAPPITIPELQSKKKLPIPNIDPLAKKNDSTFVNVSIRAINVQESKSSTKAIQRLQYSVYFLIALLIILMIFLMVFLYLRKI